MTFNPLNLGNCGNNIYSDNEGTTATSTQEKSYIYYILCYPYEKVN